MMLIALLSCTVPLLYLRRVPEQDFGHGVSALWLAGFVSYYAMPYIVRLPALLTVFVATVSFAAYLFLVPPELEYTRSLYPLLVAAFTGIVAFSATKRAASGTWVRVVRFMAGYSFSLYLVHNSLLKGMAKVWSGDPYVMTLVGIVAANVVSIAIAVPTEMRHKQFAKWLRSMLKMDAVPTVSASSADRLSRQTETR
jgi:peptidoglycan/LPS O-acetylase OafA/YrhL